MSASREFIIPISPLRYPGGKRKLAHVVHSLLELDSEPAELLVEPFVGGAAVAISFLENTDARIAIADADPLVATFWKVVFSAKAPDLANMVLETKPTLDLWRQTRASKLTSDLGRAYKCLFLNRTSFSGILNKRAGPIGGLEQTSNYGLGCRFNAEALAARILTLSEYRDRVIMLGCQDWRDTASVIRKKVRGSKRRKLVWYLDPPFFEKADRLYQKVFTKTDHIRLSRQIDRLPGRFILSYDDVPSARAMYCKHPGFMRINLSYNARVDRDERLLASELLVSNIITGLRARNVLRPMGQLIALPIRGQASHLVLCVNQTDAPIRSIANCH